MYYTTLVLLSKEEGGIFNLTSGLVSGKVISDVTSPER